ncbi:integral membrane protein 2B [Platysternon megacephalum]|uniref:Integral membrane protein 2B n=1 Tax=Platysternon megacephalum TaxID=55544 RepID=A0A4D9EHP8_9SAUR|nr:integral membrane protein 2B [Platysternon megacephalum]
MPAGMWQQKLGACVATEMRSPLLPRPTQLTTARTKVSKGLAGAVMKIAVVEGNKHARLERWCDAAGWDSGELVSILCSATNLLHGSAVAKNARLGGLQIITDGQDPTPTFPYRHDFVFD